MPLGSFRKAPAVYVWPAFLVPFGSLSVSSSRARAGSREARAFLVAVHCLFFASAFCAHLRAGRVCSARLPLARLGNYVPRSSFNVYLGLA